MYILMQKVVLVIGYQILNVFYVLYRQKILVLVMNNMLNMLNIIMGNLCVKFRGISQCVEFEKEI